MALASPKNDKHESFMSTVVLLSNFTYNSQSMFHHIHNVHTNCTVPTAIIKSIPGAKTVCQCVDTALNPQGTPAKIVYAFNPFICVIK